MSKELILVTHCDGGGEKHPADETIPFAYRGGNYELDTCVAHASEFDAHISYLIDVARKAKRGKRAAKPTAPISGEPQPVRQRTSEKDGYEQRKKIRAWARKNGWPDQSDIGIIKREVQDAYYAAHPGEEPS